LLFAILTFAKPHKANKLNLTSLAPTELRFCLGHPARHSQALRHSQIPSPAIRAFSKTHQLGHIPTRPHLRNYTTFAPQVRKPHTIESHAVV